IKNRPEWGRLEASNPSMASSLLSPLLGRVGTEEDRLAVVRGMSLGGASLTEMESDLCAVDGLKSSVLVKLQELSLGGEKKASLFDISDITDDQFFEQAEAKVIEALRQYAETAQSEQKLQKRLFSEDAVRGFAFVDLCHRRYDVALMNPPFGMPAKGAKGYIEEHFPDSKGDIL